MPTEPTGTGATGTEPAEGAGIGASPVGFRSGVPSDLLLIIDGLQSQLDDLAAAVEANQRVIADQARQIADLQHRTPPDPDRS